MRKNNRRTMYDKKEKKRKKRGLKVKETNSRSVIGNGGLRPGTWHRFLLEYLPHVLRRENERSAWVVMRWRGWWGNACTVELPSPVSLEFYGTSASGGGTGATGGTQAEPWRPPSTHDRGAGQETAPLVGPRCEAVRDLLRQQPSFFYFLFLSLSLSNSP